MKRKRKCRGEGVPKPTKRCKTENVQVTHPVLEKYYRRVVTLRNYILATLSRTSRQRKYLLASRKVSQNDDNAAAYDLLDAIVVCSVDSELSKSSAATVNDSDRRHYSQQAAESTGESINKSQLTSQAEVGSRSQIANLSYRHILCRNSS